MSKGGLGFFKLERFPNAMKHRIVGGYAKGALGILIAWSKRDVLYADLFAGAGRYEDNQPGSPLIVAEEARRRCELGKPPFIHCVNVERDREIFERLETNTAHIPREVITNLRGDWRKHAGTILGRIQTHNMPAVFFLDPFGFEGIELVHLVQILQGIGSDAREMIVTLNLDGMQRMISAGRAKDLKGEAHSYYDLPDRVFGTQTWRQFLVNGELPDAALPKVRALYEQQLLTTGGTGFQRIVNSIGMPTKLNGPDAYFLVFVTRSGKAFMEMNDCANKAFEDAWLAHERAEDASRAQLLLPATRPPTYFERHAQWLSTLERDAQRELIAQIFGTKVEHLHMLLADKHFGRFRQKHLGAILRRWHASDVIEMRGPASKDDTFIKWKGRATAPAS